MSDSSTAGTTDTAQDEGPAPKWHLIGPGLVVAATGVGASDLVATLIAGSAFGYVLLWTAVVGCLMKVVRVEGAGRFSWPPAPRSSSAGAASTAGPTGTSAPTS